MPFFMVTLYCSGVNLSLVVFSSEFASLQDTVSMLMLSAMMGRRRYLNWFNFFIMAVIYIKMKEGLVLFLVNYFSVFVWCYWCLYGFRLPRIRVSTPKVCMVGVSRNELRCR